MRTTLLCTLIAIMVITNVIIFAAILSISPLACAGYAVGFGVAGCLALAFLRTLLSIIIAIVEGP